MRLIDLIDLIELMHEAAKLTNSRVCFGIQVRPDGSGRTTSGTLNDGSEVTSFRVGPGKVEWKSTWAGAEILDKTIRAKVAGEREELSIQTLIFYDK